MSDVTQILSRIDQGNPSAAAELLPLVYEELRKLAAARMLSEQPGQTLQATALVHEAYVRLVGGTPEQRWNSRGHFFAAAAEAMRRILVDNARRKNRAKHGGHLARIEVDLLEITGPEVREDLVALDEALTQLATVDAPAAELVKLRFFAGLTITQAAEILALSPRSADFLWAYARTWLLEKLQGDDLSPPPDNRSYPEIL
ncbi:MAG TPA: ECF-type sigma factor [Planctomycetaceae bacterium]|nr:ECF-type sigma factor [Planctomycetaceae bacterium]